MTPSHCSGLLLGGCKAERCDFPHTTDLRCGMARHRLSPAAGTVHGIFSRGADRYDKGGSALDVPLAPRRVACTVSSLSAAALPGCGALSAPPVGATNSGSPQRTSRSHSPTATPSTRSGCATTRLI